MCPFNLIHLSCSVIYIFSNKHVINKLPNRGLFNTIKSYKLVVLAFVLFFYKELRSPGIELLNVK